MNHPDWAALDSLAYDTLEDTGLRAHLPECSRCSSLVEELRTEREFVRTALREDARDADVPPGFAIRRSPRRSRAGLLPLLAIAASLLVAMAVVFLRRPDPPPPAAAGDRRWLIPIEAAGESGLDQSCPYAVFRTSTGTMGALGLILAENGRGFSTGLWTSSGAGKPWLQRPFPNGFLSEPLSEGEVLSFLVATDGTVSYVVLDLATGRETLRVPIDGGHAYHPQVPLLMASGTERSAVVLYADGKALFSRSTDGGKSWSRLREVGAPGFRCTSAALLATPGGLHLIRARFPTLVHDVSSDGGASWTAADVPVVPREHGAPYRISAVAAGRDVHLVCHSNQGPLLLFASSDEGRTWSAATKLGSSEQSSFMIKRSADVLLIAWADPQSPGGARFLASRDAGKSWREDDGVCAGIRGGSGSPAVWIGASGDVLAGIQAAPTEDLSGRKFILVREYCSSPEPAPVALSKEKSANVEAAIGRLSHADPAVREEASRALQRVGTAALPLLDAAQRGVRDAEGRERIGLLIRQIRQGWPAAPPVWWEGSTGRPR